MLTNVTLTTSQFCQVTCQGVAMQTIGSRSSYRSTREAIPEGSTGRITGILKDEAGVAISSSALTTLTLTLWDVTGGTEDIVNEVEGIDIKNTGRGLVTSVGLVTLTLTPADTTILGATHVYEERIALIEWTWASGVKSGAHEVLFIIRNMARRPAEV